jgi:predicted Ser/Thr protein kinase
VIGRTLGPYEVLAKLGEGGMGEVYRARDTNLNRDVALKILPESFAGDADRVARFKREAQVLASINHPNIAAIYGIEANALVMELVEGEDLSQLINSGPIPLADAVSITRQLIDALEAAHEQGIVHRDLKPANIKVRTDGAVKVLDFGLAKALDANASDGSSNAMNSPTLTARATQMGMILGTAAYMAPEQARGRAVDRRADIWAFGVVLYEMLTGHRAFERRGHLDHAGGRTQGRREVGGAAGRFASASTASPSPLSRERSEAAPERDRRCEARVGRSQRRAGRAADITDCPGALRHRPVGPFDIGVGGGSRNRCRALLRAPFLPCPVGASSDGPVCGAAPWNRRLHRRGAPIQYFPRRALPHVLGGATGRPTRRAVDTAAGFDRCDGGPWYAKYG